MSPHHSLPCQSFVPNCIHQPILSSKDPFHSIFSCFRVDAQSTVSTLELKMYGVVFLCTSACLLIINRHMLQAKTYKTRQFGGLAGTAQKQQRHGRNNNVEFIIVAEL